jgi:hypothetical protein
VHDINDPGWKKREEPFDPYAPPRSESIQSGRPDSDVDPRRIPLAYLDRALTIRRIAWANFFLAIIWAPAAIGTSLMTLLMIVRAMGLNPVDYQFPRNMPTGIGWLALTAFHVGSFAFNLAIGISLRRFQPWARWMDVAIAIVVLILCLAYAGDVLVNQKPLSLLLMTSVPGVLVAGFGLLLLLSPTTARVFSSPYRERIAHYW